MLIYVTNLICPSLLEIKALQKKTCRGLPFSIAINGTKQIGNSTIQKLDYRIKMPFNKIVLRNKKFTAFFCFFYMKATLSKILGQSNKFVRSYNFLKCLHWEKIEVDKEPSLRKQTPPSSTSPGSWPISVWIRLFPFNFRSLEYSQTTLHCNFRAVCIGINGETKIFSKMCKSKKKKAATARSKTKPAS